MDFTNIDLCNIFQQLEKGSRKDYDIMVSSLKIHNLSKVGGSLNWDETILPTITQLQVIVLKLNSEHSLLVSEVLKLDWMAQSEEFSREYQSFVLNLLSAHTTLYVHKCLKLMVNRFKPSFVSSPTVSFENMSEEEKSKEEKMFQRNHDLLQKILKVVPSAIISLESLLSECHPHYRIPVLHIHECYLMNLLKVTEYIPKLRSQILQLIITQLIFLDNETPRETILEENMKELKMTEDNLDFQDEEMKPKPNKLTEVLDCLLMMMLKYINDNCFKNGELIWDNTKRMYFDLLKSFELLFLRTVKTCHVQFLMFYICSLKLDLAVSFLEFLWGKVTSVNLDSMCRQLAASYLGSYLARAKYIPIKLVKCQLLRMKDWIHNYIETCSESFRPIFDIHRPFYFVCQSFFYIIVFRHKDIIDTPKGQKFCMGLQIQKMVSCLLNPLRFCYFTIAETFCAVVRNNHIAFCDTILEKNRRQMIAESDEGNYKNFLSSYFPFDPYVLSRSKELLASCYLDYDNSVFSASTKQETLAEELDYMEFEENNAPAFPRSSPVDAKCSQKFADFFLYSTSPGFKH